MDRSINKKIGDLQIKTTSLTVWENSKLAQKTLK